MYQIRLVNRDGTTETIYDQSQMNNYSVIAPKYSFEIGEAGSLSFTLNPDHPLIDELKPIASHVQALDDGEEIFYGRVIQRTDPTLSGQVTFQCEGALTFLLDSEIPPYGKDSGGNQITKSLTAEQFLNECITAHNADVNETRRQFTVGTVNATNRGETADYSITSFTQTKSALESQLVNNYGGFLRTRPNPQGGRFIDWIENYSTVNPQAITIGENVLSQTNEADGTSLFTVLRPVGDDGIMLTEKTIDLYSAEDMAKYGRIVKTIEFKGADTEAKLRTEATKYKNKACTTLFQNSSIQLVDMHYLDGTVPKIHGGDRFTNIHGLEGEEMTAASLEIDFENPQNSSVGLKNRKSLDPDMTPEGNAHRGRGAVSRSSHRSSNAVGQHFKTLKETGDDLEILATNLHMQGETLTQHYQTIQTQAGYIESLSSRVDTAEGVIASHTTQFDGITYRVRQIEGTDVIQNSQAIAQIAGKFEVLNGSDGTTIVHLKDGAEFAVDGENGTTINVGTRLLSVIDETNAMASFVNTFQGSALWSQRDQITGVCGEYDVVEERVPDPEHTGEYLIRKTLVIRSGGGMRIRKDGAEYGVYMSADRAFTPVTLPPDVTGINPRSNHWYEKNGDEYRLTTDTTAQSGKTYYIQETNKNAVLTGGLMVEKINNDTTTKIRGDRVEITAQDVKIVADKTLDSVVGHFTEEEFEYEDEEGETQIGHRLVYIADGGMKVRRIDENDVVTEYGVYDEGTLTAGIIAEKINNDRTTYIVGQRILVGDELTDGNLPDWCQDASGLIAARATIGQLQAVSARVSALEADIVSTTFLKSRLADLDTATIAALNITGTLGATYLDAGRIRFRTSSGAGYVYSDLKDLFLTSVTLSGPDSNNQYTLKSHTANNGETTIGTFSRAVTSMNWSWGSGGVLSVTPQPQDNSFTIGRLSAGGRQNADGTAYTSGNSWYIPINMLWGNSEQYSESTQFKTLVDAQPNYNAGWAAAYNSTHSKTYTVGSNTYDYTPTTTVASDKRQQYIRVATPNVNVDGSLISTSYYVTSDANDAYIRYGSASGAIVAAVNHGKYNAGWAAAYNSTHNKTYTVSNKTYSYNPTSTVNSSGRLNYIRVATPNSTVDGSLISTLYYVTVSDGYAYIRYGSTSGAIVAQQSVPTSASTLSFSGTNSDGTNSTFQVTASGGSGTDSKTIYLSAYNGRVYATTGNYYTLSNCVVRGSIEYPPKYDESCSLGYDGTNNNATNQYVYVNATSNYCGSASDILYMTASDKKVYLTTGNWFGNGTYQIRASCPVTVSFGTPYSQSDKPSGTNVGTVGVSSSRGYIYFDVSINGTNHRYYIYARV